MAKGKSQPPLTPPSKGGGLDTELNGMASTDDRWHN